MTAYISMMATTTNNNPSTALYNDKNQVTKDLETIEREYIKKVLFLLINLLLKMKMILAILDTTLQVMNI